MTDVQSREQRGLTVFVAVVAVALVASFALFLTSREDEKVFCEAYGVVMNNEVFVDGLLVGPSAGERGNCFGEFGHLILPETDEWRGVLWDDCVISWRDGERSTAADEGVECEPA